MKQRIYIAGPMTGLPEFNYPAFHQAEDLLRTAGYEVENPARNPDPEPRTWENYMRMALRQLSHCDTICFLPGWEKSKGARPEQHVAEQLGLRVMFYELAQAAAF